MAFTKYRILIFSENPDKLMEFYRDVLEFKLVEQLNIPGDYGYMFNVVGDQNLWIGKHSEIKGAAKENFRHLFNLYPEEGVEFWYGKIKDKAEIVAEPYLAPFSTPDNQVWFCTFLDPEGNCWQFVGKK
ncbi:MAG TPA: VOC family protein [Candidatus Saccharimonadales bacterium]|nr:VOC family protein [Candidatus Saccharimonadales bacterium]